MTTVEREGFAHETGYQRHAHVHETLNQISIESFSPYISKIIWSLSVGEDRTVWSAVVNEYFARTVHAVNNLKKEMSEFVSYDLETDVQRILQWKKQREKSYRRF